MTDSSQTVAGNATLPWAGADDIRLLREYPLVGMYEMASRLGRTPSAVRHRASKIGAAIRRRRWTANEDDILKKAWAGPPHSAAKHAARLLPHRALHSINKRANALGLEAPVEWQPWEDAVLRKCAAGGFDGWQRAAERLRHRSVIAISLRGRKLGLRIARRWTSEEDAIVRREWARGVRGATRRVQAELPHRSPKAITGRAQLLCRERLTSLPPQPEWTAEEDAILARVWSHGARGAADRALRLLPQRTRSAIASRATRLKLSPRANSVLAATPSFLHPRRRRKRRRSASQGSGLSPSASGSQRRPTTNSNGSSSHHPEWNGSHRPSRAYQLRLAGLTFEQIAAELGYEDAGQAEARTRDWAKADGITWPVAFPAERSAA